MNRSRARSIFSTISDALDMASDDWPVGRMAFGGLILLVAMTISNWKFMVPFLLVIGGVVLFLRLSRPKDSL